MYQGKHLLVHKHSTLLPALEKLDLNKCHINIFESQTQANSLMLPQCAFKRISLCACCPCPSKICPYSATGNTSSRHSIFNDRALSLNSFGTLIHEDPFPNGLAAHQPVQESGGDSSHATLPPWKKLNSVIYNVPIFSFLDPHCPAQPRMHS